MPLIRLSRRRDPEREARRLRQRFATISRRYEWAIQRRRLREFVVFASLAASASFVVCWLLLALSPWPIGSLFGR